LAAKKSALFSFFDYFAHPSLNLRCAEGAKFFFRKSFRRNLKMRLLVQLFWQKSAAKISGKITQVCTPYP
jgi:hypothetical protein